MANLNIKYNLSTIEAGSGVFSQHEPIEVSVEISGTSEPCSVSMKFSQWEFHLVPQGNKRYRLDLSRAMRKATKGMRIANATAFPYSIRVVTQSGQEYISPSKSVTLSASNIATYGEDELDRAFQEVVNA